MRYARAALPVNDVDRHRVLLARVRPLAEETAARRTRLLEAIAWPRDVEERFFARGARELPAVSYVVDRAGHEARIAEVSDALAKVDGDDPVAAWVRACLQSIIDANRLVLAVGTTEFYRLSREVYGGARTRFHGTGARNVDLANHLLERLTVHGWDEASDPEGPTYTDEAFAAELVRRAQAQHPGLALEVKVDDRVAAKVLAGSTRVRVRKGAIFHAWEADGLWHHEVETHVLSAQNGALQPEVPFLRAGGPRSTRTQEGLAVFSELHQHALSAPRMERLAVRVQLVEMAEQGADFLELYRFLRGRGSEARDAWLDAQRVCRGGRVEGGAPFTKDASYLAGLLDVQTFLAVVARGGFRDELELLLAGRIELDDLHALVILRREGILQRPRFLPTWLRRWSTFVTQFAFLSFAGDMATETLAARYAALVAEAAAHRAPAEGGR